MTFEDRYRLIAFVAQVSNVVLRSSF